MSLRSSMLPPPATQNQALSVYRVPPGKPTRVALCSNAWLGFWTHFHDGRTWACPGEDVCTLCEAGSTSRWHGAIVASNRNGSVFKLMIFTAPCVPPLLAIAEEGLNLQGHVFDFWRVAEDKRSMMQCCFTGETIVPKTVFSTDDLRFHVERIFTPSFIKKPSDGSEAKSPIEYHNSPNSGKM